jgi:hypothetical protein
LFSMPMSLSITQGQISSILGQPFAWLLHV